jgi:hypothetical protein
VIYILETELEGDGFSFEIFVECFLTQIFAKSGLFEPAKWGRHVSLVVPKYKRIIIQIQRLLKS